MSPHSIHAAARRIADSRSRSDERTDAELLGRFLDARDQAAFAELVARHGPAVLAVCRSVLTDPNDADDAAQATFLVLVRRAAAVRDRAALGAWLCRVAWRTANRLRTDNARRNGRNAGVDPDSTPANEPGTDGLALAAVLDEIGKLPEVYRTAVLTCYATGTSTAEAARQLGWPKGTLLTRLAWARKRLGARLSQRGVTLAGGLAAVLTGRVTPHAAARLAGRITPTAAALAAGEPVDNGLVSERVLPLTNGVVRAMIGTKLKAAIGIGLLAAVLLGLGLGRSTVGTAEANAGDTKKPLAADKTERADRGAPAKADEQPSNAAATNAPAKELTVRRPLGSYTREVKPFGRATITFTEDRLHVHAVVNIEDATLTIDADADYSINRESTVYGVITGADVSGAGDEIAAEAMVYGALVTDFPFAFRVRVEDDAITIKDLKAGPFGTPMLMEVLTEGTGYQEETRFLTTAVAGKYKSDPNPDRNAPPVQRPKKK
ncbi:RNA polymerase sigma factor [Gemmata sp. JC673]|uniref:RNA polymerase sigma factor n=1 Tax=Gemmata algarum TaxID=2975278 RepID=A0ABU5F0F7_9BACT|nr:RNA polymerase sigma factor [Gemmata algarum]MDY3561051.1 RNA polymerase sigma factor [Gemmata algarum]